jgi:hypothetical protein
MTTRVLVATFAALLAVTGLASGLALAEEPAAPDRPEYVEHLEAICKPRSQETEKAVKGLPADVKAERLKVAAHKFSAADRIFKATLAEISPVPRPQADRPKLAKWFGFLDRQEEYLGQIVAALRADQPVRAQRLTSRFVHNGNLANNVVLPFGFNYCRFEFSRFR